MITSVENISAEEFKQLHGADYMHIMEQLGEGPLPTLSRLVDTVSRLMSEQFLEVYRAKHPDFDMPFYVPHIINYKPTSPEQRTQFMLNLKGTELPPVIIPEPAYFVPKHGGGGTAVPKYITRPANRPDYEGISFISFLRREGVNGPEFLTHCRKLPSLSNDVWVTCKDLGMSVGLSVNQFNISSGRGTEKGITTMNYPLIWSDDTGENMFAADEVIRYCWREFNGTGVAAIVGHLHSRAIMPLMAIRRYLKSAEYLIDATALYNNQFYGDRYLSAAVREDAGLNAYLRSRITDLIVDRPLEDILGFL